MSGEKIQCTNCGDIIQSHHRHDFKWCSCESIAIDGGEDYTHVVGAPENIIYLKTIIDSKVKLYHQLIKLTEALNNDEDLIIDNDVDLMYLLSKDPDIRETLKKNLNEKN